MHKKSDDEIRDYQEKKNHQDFIYQTNQAIQNINNSLISLALQHDKNVSKSESDKKYLSIAFENLEQNVTKQCYNTSHLCTKTLDDLCESTTMIQACLEALDKECVKHDVFDGMIKLLSKKLDDFKKESHDINISNTVACEKLFIMIREKIDKLRKEFTPVIPEVDPVKAYIDERFKEFRVDLEGITKEISILKKAVAYDEKKFENVYTLIERLKGKL